jgi:hypothetical protein
MHMIHPRKRVLFVVLSLADLAMTCLLLGRSGGEVAEVNPVAGWWLERFGTAGLAGFKAAVVAVVLLLTAAVARLRPVAAGRVLGLGCGALDAVVLYSSALLAADVRTFLGAERPLSEEEIRAENAAEVAKLAPAARIYERYDARITALAREVAAGRRTLRQAAAALAQTARGRDPAFIAKLVIHLCPGGSSEECLAAQVLVRAVLAAREDPERAWHVALGLEDEFRRVFSRPAPNFHRISLTPLSQGATRAEA